MQDDIRHVALEELAKENVRRLVDAEKAKILAVMGQSMWQRFLAWLPFNVTWKSK